MIELREALGAFLLPAALAVFGGVARACRFGVASWKQFFGSVVVSAFTGILVHLLIQDMALSEHQKAAIVAASGYSGGAILDAAIAAITRKIERLAEK